jgi:hypothetical protein
MALNATLWYRAAAWARQARARPDMTLWWSCCGTPSLGAQTSIGRHGARDVLVASCAHCGAEWLSQSQAQNPGDWRPMQHGGVAAARPACRHMPSKTSKSEAPGAGASGATRKTEGRGAAPCQADATGAHFVFAVKVKRCSAPSSPRP